ncbi:putative Tripeptidyl-peptidase I [Oenococcus oeni]|uniref:S53 family peptidase n=1 Tax=Oenococcus oeni TaxID=1247 RepID=UPI0010B5134F|nr:S53 family peptidase [Oenococcus oeni]SYW02501.1 putative Tripeptidyl-peptidase I [Oenococcus oeni]
MKRIRILFLSFAISFGLLLFFAKNQLVFASSDRGSVSQTVTSKVLNQATYGSQVSGDTQETVDIILKPQNGSALENYVYNTVTPGSSQYRKYVTASQFGRLYGSAAVGQAVIKYLNGFGLHSSLSNDDLIIQTTGATSKIESAFRTSIYQAKYRGRSFRAAKKNPSLPLQYSNKILGVLGLTTYNTLTTNVQKLPSSLSKSGSTQNTLSSYPSSPQSFASRYNLNQLYKEGLTGAGQQMDIISLADFNPADAYSYWKALNISVPSNKLNVINVDGGSGWDGSDETSLDVEQSGALAPQAKINVYIGPNTDTGFFDALSTAVNQDKAAQLSVSWGESETEISQAVSQGVETPVYAQIFNLIFEQASAEGISSFVASGDQGAYDATKDAATYDLAVDNPADSPFVVAAGGTTIPFSETLSDGTNISVKNERTWSWDYLYSYFDKKGLSSTASGLADYFVGGGGGFSKFFATPRYQQAISGVNRYTALQYWQSSSPFTTVQRLQPAVSSSGSGTGRNVPDVSLNADPETGYAVYYSSGTGQAAVWDGPYGGTSFVAPQLNAVSAIINSGRKSRIGFWNPQIYRFAKSKNSPFNPLDSSSDNNNLFYTGTKGTIYNQDTGLGTVDFQKLRQSFGQN